MALYQQNIALAENPALAVQARQELDLRLIEEFGSTDYQNALLTIAANPANYIDGRWGLTHAAITISKLELLRVSGATTQQITELSESEIAHWYSREAVARCNDGLGFDPINWGEDSRLDYMSLVLFVEWYLSNL